MKDISKVLKKNPSVSVIIPSYQRHEEVIRAVTSATRQTMAPYEIIVVNDGPDQKKREILDSLSVDNLVYIEAPRRKLASATRNYGIMQASGNWIALLDDDDQWVEKKLEAQFKAMADCGLDEAVLTGVELIHVEGHKAHKSPMISKAVVKKADHILFSRGGGVHTSTLLAPAWLFKKIMFDETIERHEDWQWVLNAGKQLDIVVCPEVLCHRYIKKGERISRPGGFEFSRDWYIRNRDLMSKKGRAEFVSRILASKSAYDKNIQGLFWSFYELIRCFPQGAGMMPALFFPWLIPEAMRAKIKNLLRS